VARRVTTPAAAAVFSVAPVASVAAPVASAAVRVALAVAVAVASAAVPVARAVRVASAAVPAASVVAVASVAAGKAEPNETAPRCVRVPPRKCSEQRDAHLELDADGREALGLLLEIRSSEGALLVARRRET
jgi:hypothetical protein